MRNHENIAYHQEELADCGAVQLCYDSFGDPANSPILLIMGLATQMVHWHSEFCKSLAAKGFWVIRFDNRDIGKSTTLRHLPPPSMLKLGAHRYFKTPFSAAYTLDDMAEDAVQLMNQLGIYSAHLIGASMGGMISQLIALNHPERVMSLTCIMSSTGEAKLMRPEIQVLLTILKPAAKNRAAHINQSLNMWRILHGTHFPFPENEFRQTIISAYERGISAAGILRQMAAIAVSPDRTSRLKQLHIPTLIIHGKADKLLPVKNGHALAKAIPDSKLHLINGMGHTLPQQVWPEIIMAFTALVAAAETKTGNEG
ncbi:MAG: alpha/beta fold hydrolase [Aestuariibacter sp.]